MIAHGAARWVAIDDFHFLHACDVVAAPCSLPAIYRRTELPMRLTALAMIDVGGGAGGAEPCPRSPPDQGSSRRRRERCSVLHIVNYWWRSHPPCR